MARKKVKLVYGVGVNDVDHIVEVSEDSRKSYTVWVDMLRRCYSESFLAKRPSYLGCYVCEEWKYFSNFKAWMGEQNWKGRHLDKDLLVRGNKIYGPETCIFITQRMNSFLCEARSIRGPYPIGVAFLKDRQKFTAVCGNPFTGKREHLGCFDKTEDAHEAWRLRKLDHALKLAEEETEERIAFAIVSRYANYNSNIYVSEED